MRTVLRSIFRLAFVALVLFIGVLLVNMITFSSKQLKVDAVILEPVSDQVFARLSEAVRIPTVSHNLKVDTLPFRQLDSLLLRSFPKTMAQLERLPVPGLGLAFKWPGKNPNLQPILLTGHMDVVPAQSDTTDGWTYLPFSGEQAEGFIWGRGTLDDKMQIMGLFEAVESLLSDGYYPQRSVYFAFGHDEEIEGKEGAKVIAQYFADTGVHFDFVLDEGSIILENALKGLKEPLAMIGIGEKGNATYTISVAMRSGGHSSMPVDETVIGLLAEAVMTLRAKPFPAKIDGATKGFFEYVGPEMGAFQKLLMANLWCTDGLIINTLEQDAASNAMIRTTIAPTIIKGGIQENVLPFRAVAKVNLRILPGETVESARAYMESVLNDPRIQVQVSEERPGNDPSPLSSTESFGFDVIRKTVQEVFPGVKVAPSLVIAATDGRHYTEVADNVYRFCPVQLDRTDLKRIHGLDERISEAGYKQMIGFYKQLMKNSCR
ncbi:MAG: M20 family peptidase [Phaeodactylibacter sp.]|nr:M20 family peptidase [Phaeodactylibacter sp.]